MARQGTRLGLDRQGSARQGRARDTGLYSQINEEINHYDTPAHKSHH